VTPDALKKVYCATLGCDKNLVDSEALLGRFALQGVQPVDDLAEADIWILNTCGFIDAARSDSEETLQQLIDLKRGQTLVVCGCWTQEHGQAIRDRFPEVDVVAGVGQFDKVVAACLDRPAQPDLARAEPGAFPLAGPPIVQEPTEVHYAGLTDRPLLTPGHLAFVKIGEGCNFNCAFCRIPMIRGRQQSRPIAEIVTEVRNLAARGVTEIQLVSQNTSDFGRDSGEDLLSLVRALDQVDGLRRIRLLYIYAGLVTVDDVLRLLELPKVAHYLDIPIQHASARLLKAMKRPGGPQSNARFFRDLRREHPDLVLRSTALLGFPGEEEEDVSELADFLAEVEFDHLGTYRYSPEEGTAAAAMGDRVPEEVIMDREAVIMDLQSDISLGRQARRLGQVHEVVVDRIIPAGAGDEEGLGELVQSFADGQWLAEPGQLPVAPETVMEQTIAVGRSYHFGYDLDGLVLLPGSGLVPGRWLRARFEGVTPYDVWAEPV
jgi:ribosomal protein S12 methylthiotransferase